MSLTIENFLFVGSLLLLISIFAGKTSYKFGVPTLVLFLLIGMLSGSEGIGGIHFDNPEVFLPLLPALYSDLYTYWQSISKFQCP